MVIPPCITHRLSKNYVFQQPASTSIGSSLDVGRAAAQLYGIENAERTAGRLPRLGEPGNSPTIGDGVHIGPRIPIVSNLVNVRDLGHSAGSKALFSHVEFGLEERERIGLIGPNGSGKSTLLALISGVEPPDNGEVIRRRGLRLSTVEQFLPGVLSEMTLRDALLERSPENERITHAYRADMMLETLGFSPGQFEQSVGALSGGQQNRLMFARAVIDEPELVLFDEPTNHLDLASIQVFEQLLSEGPGHAFVLVSHDRDFLDAVTNRTLILRDQRVYRFDQPCSQARQRLLEHDIAAAATREAEEKRLDALRTSARRLATWGKIHDNEKFARRAKSMERRVERLEAERTFVTRGSGLALDLDLGETRARRVLALRDLEIRPPHADGGSPPLFEIDTLTIRPGDRVALLGANGTGKTSLIVRLVEHFRHQVDDRSLIAFSPQTRLGYYDQELSGFDSSRSMIDYLRETTEANDHDIRAALIHAGFPYADHGRALNVLSGGERARIVFVSLHLDNPNFLILDEPTNHIDIEGKEQLEAQLLDSDATVLITSHDRRFVDNIAQRFVAIENGRLQELAVPEDFYRRLTPQRATRLDGPTDEPDRPDEHDVDAALQKLVELEQRLDEDLARKPKHQKPRLQAVWQAEIEALNAQLDRP